MNKLALFSLAASAAMVPAVVAAQQGTVDPPKPWEDTPEVRLRAPAPPPGVTKLPPPVVRKVAPAPMHHAAPPVIRRVETVRIPAPPPVVRHAPPAPHAAPGHHAPVHAEKMHHDGGHGGMHEKRERVIVRHGGGDRVERFHIRRSAPHYSRVDRGHRVDPYWMGPGYHVRDWNRYGFSQPYQDQRWVRYYDDALLIDRHGTVHDGRYGMDWDEYGERWHEDDGRGAPVYGGDGDYYPDDEDYGYAEDHGDCAPGCGYGAGYGYPGGHGGCPGGYGYYGYGYGYGGMVTVTETTVTTAPTVVETIHYEDVVTKHKAKKRHHKPKSKTLRHRGERG